MKTALLLLLTYTFFSAYADDSATLTFTDYLSRHCFDDDLSDYHLKKAHDVCEGDVELVSFDQVPLTTQWGDALCPLYQSSEITSVYLCQ